MKCNKCGNDIQANARFCKFCGTKAGSIVNPEKICPKCGATAVVSAKFCSNCGSLFSVPQASQNTAQFPQPTAPASQNAVPFPQPARKAGNVRSFQNYQSTSHQNIQNKNPGRKNKFLRRVIAILLVAVLLFTAFVKPGFLRKKPDIEEPVKKIKYMASSESQIMSSGQLTAVFPASGVTVALTPFILDDGQNEKMTVESMSPVYDNSGNYVIKPYRLSLGDIHELEDFVEIRIPYDTSFCDAGENPADCVGGVYYNPETGEWEETLYTIDEKTKEVVILTDHFSDFGAMTIKNKGTRDAILCGSFSADGDIGYLTESQAISTMQVMCQNNSADSPTARLAGTQVVQAAMSLGGAAAELNDTAGAAFNLGYFLDLTDNAMTGYYLEIAPEIEVWGQKLGSKLDPRFAYSNKTFNLYNSDMIKKSGEVLSNVGTMVSACKLGYLAGKAIAGESEDSEIFDLYKECAGMAVNVSGSVTLSTLMGPIMLADTFINYMFTESLAIKEGEVEEMYIWFNEKYPGTGAPYYTRKGRSAADWRKQIIKLIKENPQEDTADLLEFEINEFCNDFWDLTAEEMADVAAQCPKNIKRITNTDKKMRNKITTAYKKDLYNRLNMSVMVSVRDYFNKQMLKETQKSIANAKKFYNQKITFDIFEPDKTDSKGNIIENADSLYGGFKCCFMPLSGEADIASWSSTLPDKNVGLHGEFTLIGHITSGKPDCLAVFKPDADVTKDEPVLTVPFTIGKDNNVRIILEKKEQDNIAAFCGTWYDEGGSELKIDTFDDGKLGIYNFGWSNDWMYSEYAPMPKGSVVKLYGEECPVQESSDLIRLISPKASTFALSSDGEYYACIDGERTTLVLFFLGSAYVYTREKPEKDSPGQDIPEPFQDRTVDPYAYVIPEGDND